jgi:hypothetical protein
MTGEQRPDEVVRSWIRSGPELASADFVERTLRPVPRMRQRRSWRVALEDAARPALGLAGAAATIAVLVVGIGLLAQRPGAGGVGPSASQSRTPSPVPPSFELRITGSPGEGVYVTDSSTSLNLCSQAPDGSWRLLYAGGEPFVNLDLLVGAGALRPGGSSNVAAEIYAGAGYVRFDPAVLRGGDPPGRSVASVTVEDLDTTTRFVVTATTPDRTTGDDGASVVIALTVICPD